jgi:hypothetical protein
MNERNAKGPPGPIRVPETIQPIRTPHGGVMASQRSIVGRINEINNELQLLERERVGLVGTYRANRLAEIRAGKIPARDIGVLRHEEQVNADRTEAILRENMAADDMARRQGLMA